MEPVGAPRRPIGPWVAIVGAIVFYASGSAFLPSPAEILGPPLRAAAGETEAY